MARHKSGKAGRRVNIYLPPESDKIAGQIDNLSEFIQVALSQASGIMAFDILVRAERAKKNAPPTAEAVAEWNENHPLDPLTATRLGKEKLQNGTAPNLITGNPALDN